MENETRASGLMGLGATKSIGLQAKDYKVGDKITIVIRSYGEFQHYYEDMVLQPADRLVEIELTSVKAVKKQEFIDA